MREGEKGIHAVGEGQSTLHPGWGEVVSSLESDAHIAAPISHRPPLGYESGVTRPGLGTTALLLASLAP